MTRARSGTAMLPSRAGDADPAELLVARTGRRLAAFTMVLVAALLLAVGTVTAIVATSLMDVEIDRALDATVLAVAREGWEGEEVEHITLSAGMFVILLDSEGSVRASAGRVPASLPDSDAVGAAIEGGRDTREWHDGNVHVRLLTLPASLAGDDDHGLVSGSVQAGMVLTLHDRQEQELMASIALVSLLGLLGAGFVTLLVTRRALAPIRRAFATERRFVAAASHELRTPLAIVRASAEILDREGHISDAGRPLLADIVTETGRMGRLVGDLLSLAALQARVVPVELRRVELASWLTGLARRARSLAEGRGLTLTADLASGGSVIVEADPDRLAQLLLILVDNAVEHSPKGGTVALALEVEGHAALISVSDQGSGVPVGERTRIFEPFARLASRRRSGQGSGLGLAIARELAVRHGGTLAVDDAPDGGARFWLRLPLARELAAMTTAPEPSEGTG